MNLFSYLFIKLQNKKMNSFECPKSIKSIKNNTWNIRLLVDDSFVPSSKQPSIIYCRLTDFCWLDFLIGRKSEHCSILWKSWISKSGFWLWIIVRVYVGVGAYIIYRVRGETILTEHSNFLWSYLFNSYFFNNFIAMVNNMKV